MKKILFIIITIFTFGLFASNVNALTEEQRLKKLDELPFVIVDDVRQWNVKVIDPDIMLEDGRCEPDRNEYDEWMDTDPIMPSTWEDWREERLNYCKAEFYSNVIQLYLKSLGFDSNYSAGFNSEEPDKNLATVYYSIDDESSEYEVTINYLSNANSNKFDQATDVLNKMDKKYSMFGMDLINSVYHYGISDSQTTYSDNKVINRYSKLKQMVELNPTYDFVTHLISGMGTPYFSIYQGQIAVIEDGILYNIKNISFYEHIIIYVDEDEEGNVFTKAQKRLKDYFNNSVNVIVDGSMSWCLDGPDLDRIVNEDLEKEIGSGYSGSVAVVRLGDIEMYVTIVEISKEDLDQYLVKSVHKSTGIEIASSSYDVAVDTSLVVKDVTSADYVKLAEKKENVDILKAYDISLEKMSDGTFIKTIDGGVKVYVPMQDNWDKEDVIQAFFIDSDGKIWETYNGNVEIFDDQIYYAFMTNHFSTYAIGSKVAVDPEITNPNTSDNIVVTITIGSASLLGLLIGTLYLKKIKTN